MYRTTDELERLFIQGDVTIREAIKHIDAGGYGIVLIVDDGRRLKGIFTDSDFRRTILNLVNLDQPISEVMNTYPLVLTKAEADLRTIRKTLQVYSIVRLPIVEADVVIDLVADSDLIGISEDKEDSNHIQPPIPVIVMAGGRGSRLDPITRVIPKPLVPLGERTILEIILDRFHRHGLRKFYISVNYKGQFIKAFLNELNHDLEISYIEEPSYLGTIGAVKLKEEELVSPFFVTNCDILVDDSMKSVYDFHQENGNDLTLVGSMLHHSVPYGVCEIGANGDLLRLKEKPEMDFLINVGIYVLNPICLKFIPEGRFFDITDLISNLLADSRKVGVYPVREGSWIDVGQLKEYRDIILDL